jgi:hypothetical protein
MALAVQVVPRGSRTRGSVSSTAMVAVDVDGCRSAVVVVGRAICECDDGELPAMMSNKGNLVINL